MIWVWWFWNICPYPWLKVYGEVDGLDRTDNDYKCGFIVTPWTIHIWTLSFSKLNYMRMIWGWWFWRNCPSKWQKIYGECDGLDRTDNDYNGGFIVTQWTIPTWTLCHFKSHCTKGQIPMMDTLYNPNVLRWGGNIHNCELKCPTLGPKMGVPEFESNFTNKSVVRWVVLHS